MASRDGYRKREYQGRYQGGQNAYVDGNTVVQFVPMPKNMPEEVPGTKRRQISASKRRYYDKANYMSLGYTVVLLVAIAGVALMCAHYLTLQSSITATSRSITRLEAELNDMKLANDEEYARIMGAVDLEEVKRIAMDELGMTYPDESQIVAYSDNDSDYVRQYEDIP